MRMLSRSGKYYRHDICCQETVVGFGRLQLHKLAASDVSIPFP
ncbi:Uncharacterised protein [Segatella copri]|nr:Uncharacterised protein [Segatella copri]